jgi:hypothetical protein
MTTKPRLLILALVAYLAGSLLSITPAGAVTMTYNRAGAVAYADRWSANGVNLMNPNAYRLPDSDCTNFVSQSVHGGSVAYDMGGSADIGWYPHYISWDAVHWFDYFWHQLHAKVTYQSVTMSSAYTTADRGDVYMYDWGRGEGWRQWRLHRPAQHRSRTFALELGLLDRDQPDHPRPDEDGHFALQYVSRLEPRTFTEDEPVWHQPSNSR